MDDIEEKTANWWLSVALWLVFVIGLITGVLIFSIFIGIVWLLFR